MLPETIKDLFEKNKLLSSLFLLGLVLAIFGAILAKKAVDLSPTKIEVLETTTSGENGQEIVIEVAGEVEKVGVYKLPFGARVEDALIAAGGLSENADRDWVERSLNRAARLIDGQKLYIPSFDFAQDSHSQVLSAKNTGQHQSISEDFSGQGSGLVNINTAGLKELDGLPGIGQVYGQNIIEHRPYSNIEELTSKGVIPKATYEKIKNLINVF